MNRCVLAFFLSVLSSLAVQSQNWTCPYDLTNNLSCSITLSVTFSQETSPGSGVCAVCTTTSVTIPANSSYSISCGDIASLCSPNTGAICNVTAMMVAPSISLMASWGNPITVGVGCSSTGNAEITVGAQTIDVREVP